MITASKRDAALAAAAYTLLTLILTWPAARHLLSRVPADLADPLLNCWILAWDADHLLRAATGHLSALGEYWNANIFFPQPLALAYSEHLTIEALQILPVYAVTHSALLCYNLIFLSTFALSALGAYLFARELTGSRAAAFVAGLAYGFAPYRFSTMSHVQVLSSQWMPFALYGVRRYFVTRRSAPLAWATAAFVAQGLSCGYYLLFFAPVILIYAAWEMSVRGLWRNAAVWQRLAIAAAAAVAAIVPFLIPYLRLRRLGFTPRSLVETRSFGADVHGYFTAEVTLNLWGRVARAWPAPEGTLFPGVTIAALAAAAVLLTWRRARDGAPHRASVIAWLLAGAGGFLAALLVLGPLRFTIGPVPVKVTDLNRLLVVIAAMTIALLAASPPARATARRWLRTPAAILTIVALFAIVMSFGPGIYVRGRMLEDRTLYLAFFDYVPGFDALRVPARFGMIVALALAALAGVAVGLVNPARRTLAAAIVSALIVVESFAVPIPVNANDTTYHRRDLAPLPGEIEPPPAVYGLVATLVPSDGVLLELPTGEPAFDARYMFYSIGHWWRLVNGYSGGEPLAYSLMSEELADAASSPARAWTALVKSGATHVVVHEAYYVPPRGRRISEWLTSHGASELGVSGGDRLFAMPR